MDTFEVTVSVDGELIRLIVDNQPNEGFANVEAYRIAKLEHPTSSVEVVDYLTVYMGRTDEQMLLPGV